jgi:hypothetical protein
MRQPATQINQRPGNEKDNHHRSQDTETVPRYSPTVLSVVANVKERIRVKALSVVSDVRNAEIEEENE